MVTWFVSFLLASLRVTDENSRTVHNESHSGRYEHEYQQSHGTLNGASVETENKVSAFFERDYQQTPGVLNYASVQTNRAQ